MTPRLPQPGGDAGNWGEILNEFLSVEHAADGVFKNVARVSDLESKADQADLENVESQVAAKANTADVYTKSEIDEALSSKVSVSQGAYPLLFLKPGSSRDRNGAVTPTVTGDTPIVNVDGHPAWSVWEGTTNLITNPSFATAITGWSKNAGPEVFTLIADDGPGIGTCLQVESSAGGTGPYTIGMMATTPVASLTVSGVVKRIANPSVVVVVRVFEYAAGSLVKSTDVALPTSVEWTQFAYSLTTSATTDTFRVGIVQTGAGAPTYRVTNIQAEAKAYPTPFCPRYEDGVLATGNVWNGTPNASTSTRSAARLYTTLEMPADQGSFLIRYDVAPLTGKFQVLGGLGAHGGVGARALLPALNTSENRRILRQGTTADATTNGPVATGADGPRNVYVQYTQSTVSVDWGFGGGLQSTPRTGNPPPPVWDGPNRVSLGHSGNLGSAGEMGGNAYVLAVYDRPLTDAELTRAFAAMNAGTFNWNTLAATIDSPFALLEPNRKIGPGGASLLLMPGNPSLEVTELPENYVVHDSGQRLTVALTIYALLWTDYGQGWVEESELEAL